MTRVCELALGVLLIAFACGMDSFTIKSLPDQGSGGEALSLKTEWITSVVGRVNRTEGGTDGALWRSDGQGGFALTALSSLGGPDTTTRWTDLNESDPGVVMCGGDSQTTGGIIKPVMWRVPDGLPPTLIELPGLGGPQGTSAAGRSCMFPLCGGVWVVGATQRSNGAFHATAWHVEPGMPILPIDLGTLGGLNSEARGITIQSDTGEIYIVGRSQTTGGTWHACLWHTTDHGLSWDIQDRHPGGVSSMFGPLSAKGGGEVAMEELHAVGNAQSQNGRTLAGYCDMTTDGGGWTALFAKGARNAATSDGIETSYGLRVIGRAWNDAQDERAVIWNTLPGDPSPSALDAGFTLSDDLINEALVLNGIGGSGIVGSARNLGTGQRRPIVLQPNGTQLPDVVNVAVGNPESNFSEIDLWRANDGNTLRIQTQNNQGDLGVVVVRTYKDNLTAWGAAEIDLKVRVRPVGSVAAMAQMNMQFFNFLTNQWESAGGAQPLSGWSNAVGSIPVADGVDPLTGEVRVRLICSRVSGNVRGYEFDVATLTPSP